ncbi:MAG: hypothetical protein VXY92_09465 [Planctomycetota bacterium]|nr:hypothetical protein [Planctomycetota bacterium]
MARKSSNLIAALSLALSAGCSVMPRELNLTPLWFHRLDEQGQMLEWDAAWPLLHYERTPEGGDDFRVRPLYRRVTKPVDDFPADSSVDHQFLWPLGRVQRYPDQTHARLFPLLSYREAVGEAGTPEVDWYALFPLLWGGSGGDDEDYFAFLPLYADIPEFLSYRRFRTVLFPLWTSLEKNDRHHQMLLWPLIGWSNCEGGHSWFRVLPFYAHEIEEGRHERRAVLWPIFNWGQENQDAASGPVDTFFFWPFFGWREGPQVTGWTALWPFFSGTSKQGHFAVLSLFWPVFRYYWNRAEDNVTSWWVWPLFSKVDSDDQTGWSALWPLIWWREFVNPDSTNSQQWVLPFWWRVAQDFEDGRKQRYSRLWPLGHYDYEYDADGDAIRGEWSLLSPLWGRNSMTYGLQEAYGAFWELARGVTRSEDDHAVDVLGRVFTHRDRADGATASVPFLFNYERDAAGARTLRLLQFLPIPLGGGKE